MNYEKITNIIGNLNDIKNGVNSLFTKVCLTISAISVLMLIILMNQPILTTEEIEMLKSSIYITSIPFVDSKYISFYKQIYILIVIFMSLILMYFLRKDVILKIKLINDFIIEFKDIQLLREEVDNFILYYKQANESLCVTDEEKINWAIRKLKKVRKLIKEYK